MGFKLFPKDLKQWKVVVVSFVTAATFWFFNSLNKEYTTTLEYPIRFEYNTDSLMAVKKLPNSIELDVTGGGWILLRKTAIFRPKPVSVNLSEFDGLTSLSWLEMLPSIRQQISDLNINQILNDTLTIQIEPIRQKWLKPVVDSASIQLDENYRMVSPVSVLEDSVLVLAPSSFIDTLDQTFRVRIPDKEIDENYDESVPVISSRNNLVLASPTNIRVRFNVERFNRFSIEVPVETYNFPKDSSVMLAQRKVLVEFVVQESRQQSYKPNDFVIMADYKMRRKSDSSVLAILTAYPVEALEIKVAPEIIKLISNE